MRKNWKIKKRNKNNSLVLFAIRLLEFSSEVIKVKETATFPSDTGSFRNCIYSLRTLHSILYIPGKHE